MSHLKPLYEVKLVEANRQHFYQIGADETYHPGVTTVLGVINKPAILPWAVKCVSDNIREELIKVKANSLDDKLINKICDEGKNIYKKKAEDAADIGTRVHGAVNEIIHGRKPVITPDIEAGVQGFIDWSTSNSIKFELGDTKLGSKLFGYGGSMDFMAFKGDEPVIFDLKTTKKRKDRDHGIYSEYAFQLSAYAQAFHETYGMEVKHVYALWVNKEKPEFKPVKVSSIPEAFQGFLAALKLYRLSKYELFED